MRFSHEREKLIQKADEAYPIDLLPVAASYEAAAHWASHYQDADDHTRYYGFWQLFRAASIRIVHLMRGDDSFDNRARVADAYIQMSVIMLDNEREGDRFVLVGDLAFAEQCARSACHLIRDSNKSLPADHLRERAEKQFERVIRLRNAVEADPDRFVIRPRYGPFTVRPMS